MIQGNRAIAAIVAIVLSLVLAACTAGEENEPTPDIKATVDAALSEALAQRPQPNIQETVDAAVAQALAQHPLTPTSTHTPQAVISEQGAIEILKAWISFCLGDFGDDELSSDLNPDLWSYSAEIDGNTNSKNWIVTGPGLVLSGTFTKHNPGTWRVKTGIRKPDPLDGPAITFRNFLLRADPSGPLSLCF